MEKNEWISKEMTERMNVQERMEMIERVAA
jgi:hypothetical protein